MEISKFASKSAKAGDIYPLNHFRVGWQTPGIHRLMGNECVYPPSPKVIEAVCAIAPKLNWYPEDIMTDIDLREHLVDYVGLPGKPDWVIAGNGSMEIIDMLYEAFLDEGDEVIVSVPDYTLYTKRANLYGAKIVDVYPCDLDFNYKLEDFTSKITPKTKMIYVSRPNNPDGHFIPRSMVEELCKTGLIVSIDEAYYEFGEEPLEDLLLKYDNMLISHTFSKAMGLAGIRLGFVVANPVIINTLNQIRQPANINEVAHIAAIAAIDDREYIHNNVKKVIAQRERFFNEILTIPGMRPIPSASNFVMVDCLETGKKASDLQKYLFDHGYLIRNWVDSRGIPGDRFFRVTMGTEEEMTAVLSLIKEFCK